MTETSYTQFLRGCVLVLSCLLAGFSLSAQTFAGAGNPQPVPVTGTGGFPCVGGPTESVAAVAATGTVGGDFIIAEVAIDITHTWDSDLDITLISPAGTTLDLSSDNGGAGDNYTGTIFADNNPSITTGAPPFTGTFEPEGGQLNVTFASEDVNGDWTLSICDDTGGDGGTLNAWSITLAPAPMCSITCPADVTVSADAGICGATVTLPDPIVDASCVGFPGQATGSGQVPLGIDGATTIEIQNVPTTSATDVTLTVEYQGDLDGLRGGGNDESLDIDLEGLAVGFIGGSGVFADQCAVLTQTFTLTAAEYNAAAADGTLTFTTNANPAVNETLCANNYIQIDSDAALTAPPVLFTNDFNGGSSITAETFPVGTTVVTFSTLNNLGFPVTCTTTVTVTDDEAPVFTSCPSDIVLNLGEGECDVQVDFLVEATDNCDGSILGAGSATTTFAGGNGFSGNMFDVTNTSADPITLTEFFVNIDATTNMEVYFTTNQNTYVGVDDQPSEWTLLGAANVIGAGAGQPSLLPVGGLTLAAGESRGIYVTTTGATVINYTNGPINGGMPFTDGTLAIDADNGLGGAYPFNLNFQPRVWNGTIGYERVAAPVVVTQTAGFPTGSFFAPGTTTQTFTATDGSGNTETCTFTVTVNPFTNGSSTIVVNPTVQASLDPAGGCSFVNADQILEGGPYGCLDSFIITRTPAVAFGFGCPRGPVYQGAVPITCADIGRPVRVVITDPLSGNSQWANIIVEDKTAPVLSGCDDLTLPCTFDSSAGAGTGTFTSNAAVAIQSNQTQEAIASVALPADAVVLDVNVTLDIDHTWVGDLVINLESPSGTQATLWNGLCGAGDNLKVTMDDEAATCSNACADYQAGFMTLQTPACLNFDPELDPLSVLDFNSAAGDWRLVVEDQVAGDNGTINSFTLEIQYASASLPSTVTATDNCPGVTVDVSESTTNGDCGTDRSIVRTFIATDASGNTSTCSQTVTFIRPGLDAIDFPANLDGIDGPMLDCTSGFPSLDLAANQGGLVTLQQSTDIAIGAAITNGGSIQAPFALTGLPSDATIVDVNIGLEIDYTSIGDLTIRYGRQFDPNPTLLLDGSCTTRDDISATFDDEGFAQFTCSTFDPTIKGTYQPAGSLSDFDGQSPNGTFILYVTDNDGTNFDFGSVTSATVTYTYTTSQAILAPTIGGQPIGALDCQINLTFDDTIIDVCPSSYKVRRQFLAIDMCTGEEVIRNQIIAVMDATAPILECPRSEADNPIDLVAISTQQFQNPQSGYGICLGDIIVPPVQVLDDNCSGLASITTELYEFDLATELAGTQVGGVQGNGGTFTGLPLDDGIFVSALEEPNIQYVVRYVAEDSCGNQATSEVFYNVIERTAPVADCDQITSVNLTSTDTTFVDASVFDDGSYDVCSDVFFYVRRMQPQGDNVAYGNYFESQRLKQFVPFKFREDVAFTCDDDNLMVYFLVVDDFVQGYIEFTTDVTIPSLPASVRNNPNTPFTILPDGTFFLSTFPGIGGPTKDLWEGHYNLCMVEVNVDDKVAPIKVLDAPDRTILCSDNAARQRYADDQELDFDAPVFQDNCDFEVSLQIIDQTGTCGDGLIRRRFQATDDFGNVSVLCEQRITVLLEHDYTINWPNDVENVNCGQGVNLADTLGDDDISEDACDLLAISYTDQRFTADDDECYKILRTYDIINWCEYDSEADPIRIANPTFTNAGPRLDVVVNAQGVSDVRINFQPTSIQSVGRWSYVQVIKVYDDIDPTVTAGTPAACDATSVVDDVAGLGCGSGASVPFTVTDNCADDFNVEYYLVAFIDDADGDGEVTLAELSTGTSFEGQADGDPLGSLTDLGGGQYVIDGTYPLGFHAFVVTTDDGCGNDVETILPFSTEDCKAPTPKAVNGLAIDLMITGMVDVPAMMVDLGSFDGCGGVKLLIKRSSDPRSAADSTVTFTCADVGQAVPVDLIVIDDAGNEDFVETYVLVQDNLGACGNNPRIAASLTTDAGDGVEGVAVDVSGDATMSATTSATGAAGFDVSAGGDYTVSALLDADAANGVTTFDAYMIGQHILGRTPLTTFAQLTAADVNNSGTITSFDLTGITRVIVGLEDGFANNTSWRFFDANDHSSEVVSFNDVHGQVAADFLAVKIGDVNNTARANARQPLAPRTVSAEFALEAEDAVLAAGETARVTFTASDATALGYQATIEFDAAALAVVGVEGGAHKSSGFGTHLLDAGKLTLSHAGAMAGELFTLEVRALRDGVALSEVLSASSAVTAAEAYAADGSDASVALRFSGRAATAGYALEQNRPNPFSGTTAIAFTLAEAGQAELLVTDVAGRVVWRTTGEFPAGRTQVELAAGELPTAGVLSYTLTAGEFTATRKMVVIE